MGVGTALRKAARNLIDTFGNSATVYVFSGATATTSDEGDVTVSSWGSGTAIKIVDGPTPGSDLMRTVQGIEQIGQDAKIIRDDVTIANNDRVAYNSKNYRVTKLNKVQVEDIVVIYTLELSEVTDTTNW